jgi:hypothetical protein
MTAFTGETTRRCFAAPDTCVATERRASWPNTSSTAPSAMTARRLIPMTRSCERLRMLQTYARPKKTRTAFLGRAPLISSGARSCGRWQTRRSSAVPPAVPRLGEECRALIDAADSLCQAASDGARPCWRKAGGSCRRAVGRVVGPGPRHRHLGGGDHHARVERQEADAQKASAHRRLDDTALREATPAVWSHPHHDRRRRREPLGCDAAELVESPRRPLRHLDDPRWRVSRIVPRPLAPSPE